MLLKVIVQQIDHDWHSNIEALNTLSTYIYLSIC